MSDGNSFQDSLQKNRCVCFINSIHKAPIDARVVILSFRFDLRVFRRGEYCPLNNGDCEGPDGPGIADSVSWGGFYGRLSREQDPY